MSKKPSKRKQKAHKEQTQDDLVQVDAFMIPAPFAAMYQVLREAVAEDLLALLSQEFARVARVSDNEEEGEAVVAYDAADVEQLRIYLNPSNISQAQKARDKHQLDKFVDHLRQTEG